MSVIARRTRGPRLALCHRQHPVRTCAGLLVLFFGCAGFAAAPIATSGASAALPRTCDSSSSATHTVEAGETWFGIASAAGVSNHSLFVANNANADTAIFPGDVLCLPAGAAPDPVEATSTTAPTMKTGGSCPTAITDTVESDDTWIEIAARAGVPVASVLKANSATAATVIHPGDAVCLPAGATAPPTPARAASSGGPAGMRALPAQGPCWYADTWGAPRGNGRRHEGVDLISFAGSYVYAVTDGTLFRRAWDQPGSLSGNAWWLRSDDGSGTYYFYAHLSSFAPGLETGAKVRAGEIIGLVGNTGNSATAHLHFEIHPSGGAAIDPFPAVDAMGGCKAGAAYEQPGGWIPTTGDLSSTRASAIETVSESDQSTTAG